MSFPHNRRALSTKASTLPAWQITTLFLFITGADRLDSFEESSHIFLQRHVNPTRIDLSKRSGSFVLCIWQLLVYIYTSTTQFPYFP